MANLNLQIDDDLKREAEAVLKNLGISLSTATTLFLKQVVRHNGIPFGLEADTFYSVQNQSRLQEAKVRMGNNGAVRELIEE